MDTRIFEYMEDLIAGLESDGWLQLTLLSGISPPASI